MRVRGMIPTCIRDMAVDLAFVLRTWLTCRKRNVVMVSIFEATSYS
jgi:hypothetical protein